MSSSSPSFARLTSTNYTTWSGDMEAWLKSQGLWRIVSGSQKRPGLQYTLRSQGYLCHRVYVYGSWEG